MLVLTNYNFHKEFDRSNTASVKWEMNKEVFGSRDVLPMWVADMDFPPPNEVIEEIQKRAIHGIFGYTFAPSSTAEAIQNWVQKRHGWEINRSWITYSPGVVSAISTAIQSFTSPGDKVMLQSPVYSPFFQMIEKNDRTVINSPLHLVGNQYEIDFEDFEQKLKNGVKLFLLCSPHNPGSRVWSKEELRMIADLCLKHNCLILSDEIHCDLVFQPFKHYPLCSIDEKYKDIVITCMAPSKTFNIAGLQASVLIIPNATLKKAFTNTQAKQGFHGLNTFGIIGMEAAYLHGENWLDQLICYLEENISIAKQYLEEHLPNIHLIQPQGTYLLWLDCRKLQLSDEEIKERLIHKGKLALEPGTKFGSGGEGFVRMNIGCTQKTLLDGLNRLKQALG